MDDKQLRDTVKAIIDGIFSEKEEEARQRMTEEAITKSTSTINELTQALLEQKGSYSSLEEKYNEALETATEQEAKLSAMEADKQKTEEELATIKEELTTVKTNFDSLSESSEASLKELSELKEVMAEIERAKVAEVRYAALAEIGVAYTDKDKQISKIKAMTEEAFESYKEELLAIKEALTAATKPVEEPATEGASKIEEPPADDENKVALANIDKRIALSAAFNNELKAKEDILVKYQKLGQAMAARVKKEKV